MISLATQLSMIACLLMLVLLYNGRRLSPSMLMILVFMLLTGNLEMLVTAMLGKLPIELYYIRVESLDYATCLYNQAWLIFAVGLWRGTHQRQLAAALAEPGLQGLWAPHSQGLNAVRLYGILFLLSTPLEFLMSGPLRAFTQLLLPLLCLRFLPVFMLAYSYFRHGRNGSYLLAVSMFEVIANLSFFNSFRTLFTVIACAMLLAFMSGSRSRWLSALLTGALMFAVLSVWSYIKPEFRAYLNNGDITQADTRTTTEKIDFTMNLVRNMTAEDFQTGMASTMSRVAYNSFFAATVFNVPEFRPYGSGEMLFDSVRNALMPRFLFPNKPVIDDSVIAAKVTGLHISGQERGTSINVGVIGELYADMGPYLMLIAMFVFGWLMARMEGYIFTQIGSTQEALAFSAIFFGAFGTSVYSLPKFVGAMLYLFVAVVIFFRYFYRRIDRL